MSPVILLHPPSAADVAAQKFCRAVGSMCRAYRRAVALRDPEVLETICAEVLIALRTPPMENDEPVTDLLRAVASALAAEAVQQRIDISAAGEPPPDDDGEPVPVPVAA